MLDQKILKDLKFVTFSVENNSQGKLMLACSSSSRSIRLTVSARLRVPIPPSLRALAEVV